MEKVNEQMLEWMLGLGLSENLSMMIWRVTVILAIFIIAFIVDRICRRAIIPVIRKITVKTEFKWDDYILSDSVLNNLCRLIPPISIYALIPYALPDDAILDFALQLCVVYITIVCIMLVCSIISSLYAMASEHEKLKDHSMKGLYQMLKLVVICIGVIIIISTLIGKSPLVILTGLGASTAILMLVFQDTIKGFVGSIQLSANDMLRIGDWIAVGPADGNVLEINRL